MATENANNVQEVQGTEVQNEVKKESKLVKFFKTGVKVVAVGAAVAGAAFVGYLKGKKDGYESCMEDTADLREAGERQLTWEEKRRKRNSSENSDEF